MTSLKADTNLVQCPVCNRDFTQNNIEIHVNKCIFLNAQSKQNFKRACLSDENIASTQPKRVKTDSIVEICSSSSAMNIEERPQNTNKGKKQQIHNDNKDIPLAECMRPSQLDDIIGHGKSFGPGSMIHSLLLKKKIPNMILWGPPGCGKTSIANVIASICKEQTNLRFLKLSATMSGINDVKEVVKVAKNEAQFKRHTVLFMDEIHRFNKLQQDSFLPHVENGTITLIGATTENPSFSLNNALLSRCRVVVLEKLTVDNVTRILERAVEKNKLGMLVDELEGRSFENDMIKCVIERASLKWLAEMSDGDARIALGALELAISSQGTSMDTSTPSIITLQNLKDGIKRSHMMYDRKGEEHYNIISAIQKSIRASDDNAALYWTTRALHGGEDPLYIARRLIRTACEDIGLGNPNAVVEAVACLEGCKHIGMPECDVLLAQCAVRLARAPKSTEVYRAMRRVQRTLKEAKGPLPPVPLVLRNAPTNLMKDLGYAEGYNTRHRESSGLTYMPEGLENVQFFSEDDGN